MAPPKHRRGAPRLATWRALIISGVDSLVWDLLVNVWAGAFNTGAAVALGRAQRPAALARYLGRDLQQGQGHCRTLRACRVLTRTVGRGLVVQPDASRWHVPNASSREPGRGA